MEGSFFVNVVFVFEEEIEVDVKVLFGICFEDYVWYGGFELFVNVWIGILF